MYLFMCVYTSSCICKCVCVCIEVVRLQEQVILLQEEVQSGDRRRLEEVSALQQRAVRLEEQLQAAHKECTQKDQVTCAPLLNITHPLYTCPPYCECEYCEL